MNRQQRRAAAKAKQPPDMIEVQVTQELIDMADALGWTGAQVVAEAIRRAVPGAHDIEVDVGTSRCDVAPGERKN
jgi:hypothetical protein